MMPYEAFSGLLEAPTTAIVEALAISCFSSASEGLVCINAIVLNKDQGSGTRDRIRDSGFGAKDSPRRPVGEWLRFLQRRDGRSRPRPPCSLARRCWCARRQKT